MTELTLSPGFSHWGQENTVFPVSAVRVRVSADEHPLYVSHRAEIEQNWRREEEEHPAYFDGRMLLSRNLDLQEGVISGRSHMVSFSTYLWWRKQQTLAGACHLFGMAVPVSSDGAIIAIRMAPHTANPGFVYCAAGSLDESDVVDGFCDIDGNMRREVMEETGLDLGHAQSTTELYGSYSRRFVNVFRYFHFDMTAAEMLERIACHMETDTEKEIDGGVAIWNADPDAHRYNRAMAPILSMFFGKVI